MENTKKPQEQNQQPKNQGEGDKESARKYNKEATKHAREADVEKLARQAETDNNRSPDTKSKPKT